MLLDLLWVTHLPQTILQRFLSSVVCDNLQSICYTQALLSIFLEPPWFKATTLAPTSPYFHSLCMYCKVGTMINDHLRLSVWLCGISCAFLQHVTVYVTVLYRNFLPFFIVTIFNILPKLLLNALLQWNTQTLNKQK